MCVMWHVSHVSCVVCGIASRNQEGALNLTILTVSVSRPGEFSRVDSIEGAVFTPGGDGTSARCIVISKSSLAHATVVTDEPCQFFFGHVCKNERTGRVRTICMSELFIHDNGRHLDWTRTVSHLDYRHCTQCPRSNQFPV